MKNNALFGCFTDEKTGKIYIKTSIKGKALLTMPQLNKGTAFTEEERKEFGLCGKLPQRVETLDEQVERCYLQFQRFSSPLEKSIYLRNLHEISETLFYKLVSQHMHSMLPVIYTPTVGDAVEEYSREFRRPRGLFISYEDRHRIEEILDNRTNPEVDLVVVSDAEGILGIGDQGIGGIEIPVAKLMVYTLCGGFHPSRGVPVYLDCGTNNRALLDDPFYLGWRHERLTRKQYDEFIDLFVKAVRKKFPQAFLHWEDFGRDNARRNLERYRQQICTFNDDMQGTGVVTLAALLAAIKASGADFIDHRVVIFGAGTAGVGIADQICDAMCHYGLSREEAYQRFWLIDRTGLLLKDSEGLQDFQAPYARTDQDVKDWQGKDSPAGIGLAEVISNVKPTILIGSSTVGRAFSKEIIEDMASHVDRPIIFPLSNPTARAEADPRDLLEWTEGKALVATGSPFSRVHFNDKLVRIAQCNNAFVFPGIGMGVIAAGASKLTDGMLWAATEVLSELAPVHEDPEAALLPELREARAVSREIAIAVIKVAQQEGVATHAGDPAKLYDSLVWEPQYLPYRYSGQS
ncbi:NAD-dependent malic enzyme [Piscirickettsia salmonis]|uniref:NAD-dependent malic enzyme n=1 Tax=Piscirickettsia salmonis TaxID=1238 RepID=UPI000F096FF4|nr:NAD-dependent malic enzyme [Piscirickettsiaceae bacterium NZ-RLO2]